MWGQATSDISPLSALGIIPMRVGTRIYPNENLMTCEDHPHACGDKSKSQQAHCLNTGSSPCVWGQASLTDFKVGLERIIPMRVGTRKGDVINTTKYEDHPHACGDKLIILIGLKLMKRIIPMRVGTSLTPDDDGTLPKDHPHACGDKVVSSSYSIFNIGSSPCVWGQAYFLSFLRYIGRIIPMRVGTSGYFCVVIRVVWDHPHACGDKNSTNVAKLREEGSSPCVWGQGNVSFPENTKVRIIPMRVGTRKIANGIDKLSKDHPHACGDKNTHR